MIELPNKPNQRWSEYLDAESRGTRRQKLEALNRFIASLLELQQETWKGWAVELCLKRELKQITITIRQPLFERVLFPALMNAAQSGVPGSLRLLAGLFDHLCNSKSCLLELPDALQSRDLLLREELRQNPEDERAGIMLASSMAQYAAHTLHELPLGVLYGMDGASISECDELIEFIEEFQHVVTRFRLADYYKELIDDASLHYHAYRSYLQREERTGGYQEFLKSFKTP